VLILTDSNCHVSVEVLKCWCYVTLFTSACCVYMTMVQTWTSVLMNQSVVNNVITHREATNVPVTLGTPSTPLTDEPAQVRDFRLYNRQHCTAAVTL